MADKIPESALNLDLTFKGRYEKFSFRPVTEAEIRKLLKGLLVNRSTGLDGVAVRFLKMCENVSLRVLTYIINLSTATKTVPLSWKVECITPLFKEGDRAVAGNYRPIAIPPAASKLLEPVVHMQSSHGIFQIEQTAVGCPIWVRERPLDNHLHH